MEPVRKRDGYLVNNTYSTWQPSLTPERWIMLAGSSPTAPAALNTNKQLFLKAELLPRGTSRCSTDTTENYEWRVKSFLLPLDSTIWAVDSRKRKPLSNKDFTSTWMRGVDTAVRNTRMLHPTMWASIVLVCIYYLCTCALYWRVYCICS